MRDTLGAKPTRGDVGKLLEGIRRSDAMNTTAANNVVNEFSGTRLVTPRQSQPRSFALDKIKFPDKPTPAQKHNFITTYDTALRGSVGHAASVKGTNFASSVFSSSPKEAAPHTDLAARIASGFVDNDAEVKALKQNLDSAASHLTNIGQQLANGTAKPFELAETLVQHNAELTNAVDRVMENSKGQVGIKDRTEVRNALMHSVAQNANSTLMSALSKAGDLPQKLDNIIKRTRAHWLRSFRLRRRRRKKRLAVGNLLPRPMPISTSKAEKPNGFLGGVSLICWIILPIPWVRATVW